MKILRSFHVAAMVGGFMAASLPSFAETVVLQNATATFSQLNPSLGWYFTVDKAIDGDLSGASGWGVAINQTDQIPGQTAVFETATDIGFAGGSLITFALHHNYHSGFPIHTLGRFRLSLTTDDRSQFADGLHTGGDVTANWIVIDPGSYISINGATLTKLPDLSLLASGAAPFTDTYVVTALTTITGITGFRIEALEDPSLPFNGPGRQPLNGNFTLTEFSVNIFPVPEPAMVTLLVLFGCAARWFRSPRTT